MNAARLINAVCLLAAGFICAFVYDASRRVFSILTGKRSDKVYGAAFFVLAAVAYVFTLKITESEGKRAYLAFSFMAGALVYAASLFKALDFICAKCYNKLRKVIVKTKGKSNGRAKVKKNSGGRGVVGADSFGGAIVRYDISNDIARERSKKDRRVKRRDSRVAGRKKGYAKPHRDLADRLEN